MKGVAGIKTEIWVQAKMGEIGVNVEMWSSGSLLARGRAL